MRYIKMLGLAAVAVAAVMAFVGAGTASAETTLCKATEEKCSEANRVKSITSALTGGTEAVLTAGGEFLETRCAKSEVNGSIETATTPQGKISKLTFENCNRTVKVLKNGELIAHHDPELKHAGILTAKNFEVEVQAGLTCIFGGPVEKGLTFKTIGEPKTTTLEATATIPKVGGSIFCPSSAVWHANYTVSNPPLYVTTGL